MSDVPALMSFYPQIKVAHVAAVCTSGAVFALRGLLVQAGRPAWAMAAPVRYISYTVDSILLTAALMLLTMLPHAMFVNGWLATKLLLVAVYVALGTLALKRGRTPGMRMGCYVAALLAFASIIGIALAHHPLGWLLPLAGR